MTPANTPVSWTFGGALAGTPAAMAWTVLACAAIFGIAFVGWSYRRALVELPVGRRLALGGLRAAVWLGLLLLLAAPTRIHQRYDEPPGARAIAVLVDHSGSMTTPDNRQRRRLDDALRRWHEIDPVARRTHAEIKTFAFADQVRPAAVGDLPPGLNSGTTHFFASLKHVIDAAPAGGWDAIVTLTDGLDTSATTASAGADAIVQAANEKGTALYFLPGRNRYAGAPFVSLRDFNVPTQVVPKAKFHLEALVDSFQTAVRSVPIELTVANGKHTMATLTLPAGRRLATWSAEIEAGEAGTVDISLRIGDETARAETPIGRPPSNRILYFQGALDWSYRFLADILKHDASFVLTPVFNFPNPHADLPPGALRSMPEIPKELDRFDIVILANAAASQFTSQQQTALAAWVRDGGVVLFFTPDDDSTQGFAGSELEKMLPVLFSAPQSRPTSTTVMLSGLSRGYGRPDQTALSSFAWESSSRVQDIFAEAGKKLIAPQFAEYAHVAQAKPGADVLARHPTDIAPGGDGHAILLAIQRYGRGQSAVLTTDALWRWRLNEPADDRDPELFWRTLFAWLTRQREFGLRFDQTPRVAQMGEPIPLRVVGAAGAGLKVDASLGGRHDAPIEGAAEAGARVFSWLPPMPGLWRIAASDEQGHEAHHWITVKDGAQHGELSGAPPEEELMRSLATRTGGEVLELAAPVAWTTAPRNRTLLNERREPLWHQPWIFGTLLGLYGLDLILRRRWRML